MSPQLESSSPMDLPELRTKVAKFLSTHDLAAASSVCKSWHSSFIPSLYHKLQWNGKSKFPKADALLKYGNNVKEFYITRYIPKLDLSALTHLQILEQSIIIADQETWDQLTRLFQQNQNLVKVCIINSSSPWPILFPTKTFSSMMTIPSLKNLILGAFELDSESTELFFNTCQQLQDLTLFSTEFSTLNSFNLREKLPSMKSLAFNDVNSLTPEEQLEIIKRCPQIKSLRWSHRTDGLVSEFCQVLAQDCPLLEELNLEWNLTGEEMSDEEWGLSDEDCSRIIDNSIKITSLLIPSSNFGPKALNSCSRYFSTLACLDVRRSNNFTSPMAQQVMTSCHNLREFKANVLNAQDILGIAEETQEYEEEKQETLQTPITTMVPLQLQQKEWVCLDLRSLSLFIGGFEGKPRDWQRRVLHQIARLVKLEQINVVSYRPNLNPADGLDLRLEAGLDILGSLVNIEDFSFSDLSPGVEEEEARWMIKAWPRLKYVRGVC